MTNYDRCSTRLLRPVLQRTGVLGVRLVGGNAVGIFIHSIEPGSPASDVGIQRGDQVGIRKFTKNVKCSINSISGPGIQWRGSEDR